MIAFAKATYVLVKFVHIRKLSAVSDPIMTKNVSNISAVTDPILMKL